MARRADTQLTTHVPACELVPGDLLVATDGGADLFVTKVFTQGDTTRATVQRWGLGERTFQVDTQRPVTVRTEQACDCGGTGRYRFAGHMENGVWKGQEGEHFACHGKGWQSRQDAVRNLTYWNKYARIYA